MNFTVSIKHHKRLLAYLVKMEKDAIFIAFPRKKNPLPDIIFLTKTDHKWKGDIEDKKLVKKIGLEIDETLAILGTNILHCM
jgi:hypothetical protein